MPTEPSSPFSYEQVGRTEIEYTAGKAMQMELQGSARFTVNTIIRVRRAAQASKKEETRKVQAHIRLRALESATPMRVEGLGKGSALRVVGTDFDGFLLCDLLAMSKPVAGSVFEVFWSNGESSRHTIES